MVSCHGKRGRMMSYYVRYMNTVLFQKSWSRIFETLSDEDAGLLIKALFAFMDGDSVVLENDRLDGIFLMMADQIENSARKYVIKAGLDDE